MKIVWKGKGKKEKGYIHNQETILIDEKYFRPSEVESLLGNAKKAYKILKWKPKYDIHGLIDDMISSELKKIDK